MDEINKAILAQLIKNSRSTASEISKQVNLSVPAVAERIRKMETSGMINGYTVKLDRQQLGLQLIAFIMVTLDNVSSIANFRDKMVACPDVLECHHLAGQSDYLLKIRVENTNQLECFLMDVLKKTAGVASSNTLICLSTLKEELNVLEV
jgi:Lrp/AsnC family leucine-responsive transcriptional regulator